VVGKIRKPRAENVFYERKYLHLINCIANPNNHLSSSWL